MDAGKSPLNLLWLTIKDSSLVQLPISSGIDPFNLFTDTAVHSYDRIQAVYFPTIGAKFRWYFDVQLSWYISLLAGLSTNPVRSTWPATQSLGEGNLAR
jgi:hypothetical protein